MFTGLIAGLGTVAAVSGNTDEMEVCVDLGGLAQGDSIGDSIALSGVCCTVTRMEGKVRAFTLTAETLRKTWLGGLRPGDVLNIEKALRAGDPYGGHVVQGHVDAVGEVLEGIDPQQGGELWFRVPEHLRRYCVQKGSIALDGISLTIAEQRDDGAMMIAVIPHTAQVTTMGRWPAGKPLNIEVDVMAKYVERLVEHMYGGDPRKPS